MAERIIRYKIAMNSIREQFEQKLQQLNEDVGRGRGAMGGFKTAKKSFEDFTKSINYDYLNRSTHYLGSKIEKYNFNNYYTLDIRIKIDKLSKAWDDGTADYTTIFNQIYSDDMGDNLKEAFHQAYGAYYRGLEDRRLKGGKDESGIKAPEPIGIQLWMESPLEHLLEQEHYKYAYDLMPVVSIYHDEHSDEYLAIKKHEFVPLIMDGLTSAAKGHIPQGVTIEEVLEGKFARKAIAPEQGTFINRVKDPTSDKPFTFRSQQPKTLKDLHDIIMKTFKTSEQLRKIIPNMEIAETVAEALEGEPSPMLKDKIPSLNQLGARSITRKELFLYMTQEDFHRLEKGGKGFNNLIRDVIKDVGVVSEIPDF